MSRFRIEWKALLIVFLAATHAFAAQTDLSTLYSRYYPGSVQIPDLKKSLDSLLQYDHAACGSVVQQEVALLNQYGVFAAQSKRKQAEKTSHSIHQLLRAAKLVPGQPCLDAVFKTYAVGSIFLLDPGNYNAPKVTIGQGVTATDDFEAAKGATEVSALSNFPLTYLSAALANQGRLRFFVDPITADGADERNSREILGAYECETSLVYLDPWLPPLDLGATFLHELDHLFLDKKFTKEELQAEFSNPDGSVNWRAFVLDDEFAAITHSAIAQREMYVLPRSYWQWTLWGSPYTFSWSKNPYQLNADLRLFSKDGAVASLELMFEPGVSTETLLAITAARNLDLTSRYSGPRLSQIGSKDPDVLARFDKAASRILDLVNAPYFPGTPLAGADRELLQATHHGLELLPLAMWIPEHDVQVNPLLPGASVADGALLFSGPTNFFTADQKQITRVEILGMDRMIRGIDEILSSMEEPSESCKLYLDAVARGELGDYIGTTVELDSPNPGAAGARPGAAGARPGAAGARPGAAGARPGAAGARPGAAGARPGAAGARPGAGGIRPCLSLTREL